MNGPTIDDVVAAVRLVLGDRARRPEASVRDDRFAGRLLSLRTAEMLPRGTREVKVAPGTVITPLARDLLKQREIAVRVVARAEIDGVRDLGEWGLAIETGCETGAVAAFRRALFDEPVPWIELGGSAPVAARWVASSPRRGALVLADEASVAVWQACRVPGVRAAMGADIDAVDRAIRRLGVNLLVVEPAGRSISLLSQIGRTYRSAGAPRPPRGLEIEHEELR